MTELDRKLFWAGLFHPELAERDCGRYCFGCEDPRECKNTVVLKKLSKEIENERDGDDNDDA